MDYREMNEILVERMRDEYECFLIELEQKSPQEIIASSYEKVFKEDLITAIVEVPLSEKSAKALFKMRYPLDECYNQWLREDITYMEELRDSVDKCADRLIRREEREVER